MDANEARSGRGQAEAKTMRSWGIRSEMAADWGKNSIVLTL